MFPHKVTNRTRGCRYVNVVTGPPRTIKTSLKFGSGHVLKLIHGNQELTDSSKTAKECGLGDGETVSMLVHMPNTYAAHLAAQSARKEQSLFDSPENEFMAEVRKLALEYYYAAERNP